MIPKRGNRNLTIDIELTDDKELTTEQLRAIEDVIYDTIGGENIVRYAYDITQTIENFKRCRRMGDEY